MKIAVFVDKYGTILPFFSSGVVEIYSYDKGAWKCINQVALDLSQEPGMNEVLRNVRMLVSKFGGCNLLVVENVQGIVRSYLSDFRIGIWILKGLFSGEDLLNHIKQEVEKVTLEHQQIKTVAAPLLIGKEEDAVYEIDLATLLDCDASLNSREVLIPFFRNTNFRELIIICKKSPGWLEQALVLFQLLWVLDDMGDDLICLTVSPADYETGLEIRKNVRMEQISTKEEICSLSGCGSVKSCIPEITETENHVAF